jgi:hypothetical protein
MRAADRTPCPSRWPRGLLALVALGAMPAACSRSCPAPEAGTPGAEVTAPPRAIRVAEDSVIIEGHWHPIEETGKPFANAVTATCVRSERRCREELTMATDGRPPQRQSFDYKIKEWTRAKLLATRQEGSDETQLRVSLTGLAAERVMVARSKGREAESRWRLE